MSLYYHHHIELNQTYTEPPKLLVARSCHCRCHAFLFKVGRLAWATKTGNGIY